MKAGDLYVDTHINNEGFEEDLDDLVDMVEDEGEDAGEGFADKFGKGASGLKGKIENVLSKAFAKATGLGAGFVKVLNVASTIVVALGTSLLVAGVVIGAVALGVLAIAEGFKKAVAENQQWITDLQYVIWAVKQALQPAIDFVAKMVVNIINLLIKAIQLVALLIYKLTGKNIFADASVDKFKESMQQAEESTGGMAQNLKEAKKQLAGFDEMNVLQDTSSGGGGGAGGGGVGGDIPMPDFDLSDLTNIEEEVEKFKKDWYDMGEEMRKTIFEAPFEVWTEAFGKWDLYIYGLTRAIYGLWEVITGFFEFFHGLWDLIVGLVTGDTELMKKGLFELLDGLWKMIDGLINFVIGGFLTLVGLVKGICTTIGEFIGDRISDIINSFKYLFTAVGLIWGLIKEVIQDKLVEISGAVVVFVVNAVNKFNEFKQNVINIWTNIKSRIAGFIGDIYNTLSTKFGQIGTKLGEVLSGAIKGVINGIMSSLESKVNGFINNINGAIKTINKIPGVDINRLSKVSFPRLAKGGIVNMAGKGVMVGGAIAGENGREGVLPLTDSQQMELLGEAIGRYITINANITNSMNGRVISRELQRIQNDDNFAFNR